MPAAVPPSLITQRIRRVHPSGRVLPVDTLEPHSTRAPYVVRRRGAVCEAVPGEALGSEDFLYVSSRRPAGPLSLVGAPRRPAPVGWREGHRVGSLKPRESRGLRRSCQGNTRRGPHRAHVGRPGVSPIREQAYGPSPLVKSSIPSNAELARRPSLADTRDSRPLASRRQLM